MSSSILLDELFVEILSWIPVKDLMRLRCVSKSWNSLVFDPTFIKLHLQRSSKNTDTLLTFRDYENDESRYCASPCSIHGFLDNPSSTIDACHRFNHDYTVLGVCNGLVCLQDSYRGDEIEEYWVRFWNPATRVMSEDSPRIRLRSSDYNYPYLFMFGFGYNDWSDTYQVVLLDNKSHKMDVSVLCLGETCWRKMLTCPSFPTLSLHGAAVSGTVNWLALPELCSGYRWETVSVDELVIFSYDLKNVRYSYLSMPDGLLEVPPDVPVLEVLKGCLCLSHHHGKRFVVWLMREFGVEKSWTHLLNISYENLHIHGFIHAFPTLPVILCVSEDDDLMLLANYDSAEFIRYNKRDDRIDRHELFNDDKFYFFSYDYVQSLVLPCRN
ncbi:F-box/kelch-repeat protein At3g23880 [Cajanus cajan]|uniref:F-box/kelch-repeat protein At3g23880 family n=1 Tax=Cajanus cajan TaxID=3821 RepID=A0A151S7T0_CAJCA|nr:F-box/kelch-repeat protein At3g23880 [Cajanus cajan]KYP50791.1 F-box/kelch-repeat protein At3g23880 family [Cajanus cajan]